jgi:aminopeptidase-like protein
MSFEDLKEEEYARPAVGKAMHEFIRNLYPICRSITGEGVRETLRLVQKRIPLEVHEVPSGTQVFDWTVPLEWNVRDAYVANMRGERVIDFRKSNLHVVSYSQPVSARMKLEDLRSHMYSLPEKPDWIPYRTSYYKEHWGFCLTHRQYQALQDEEYDVCIDSSLTPGSLTYGECYLPGHVQDEVLLSCHVCHPSLCNDNLSGIAVATFLMEALRGRSLRYSYRVLMAPGTIGSITWLACNQDRVGNIKHGLVLACIGDSGHFTYKKSRRGTAEIDKVVAHVLKHRDPKVRILEFSPYGYDERQFCSPGFNLPVGCLMRTPHGEFQEYHTSADNLDFVTPEALRESLSGLLSIVSSLEANKTYLNTNPNCEPQLGRRGLYRSIGGTDSGKLELALLWVLNQSDGRTSLLDIAERADLEFEMTRRAADLLLEHGLLQEAVGQKCA